MENIESSLAVIVIVCGLVGRAVKASALDNRIIPVVVGTCGCVLGMAGKLILPDFPAADLFSSAVLGITSGLASTGIHQVYIQMKPDEEVEQDDADSR